MKKDDARALYYVGTVLEPPARANPTCWPGSGNDAIQLSLRRAAAAHSAHSACRCVYMGAHNGLMCVGKPLSISAKSPQITVFDEAIYLSIRNGHIGDIQLPIYMPSDITDISTIIGRYLAVA